jgi:hypothetical protein
MGGFVDSVHSDLRRVGEFRKISGFGWLVLTWQEFTKK